MLDLENERLMPLNEVPRLKWLPTRRGRRTHVSTLRRWARDGRGGVRLESVLVGGIRCTTVEALHRFFERTTAQRDGDVTASVAAEPTRTPSQQRREHRLAIEALDAAGIVA